MNASTSQGALEDTRWGLGVDMWDTKRLCGRARRGKARTTKRSVKRRKRASEILDSWLTAHTIPSVSEFVRWLDLSAVGWHESRIANRECTAKVSQYYETLTIRDGESWLVSLKQSYWQSRLSIVNVALHVAARADHVDPRAPRPYTHDSGLQTGQGIGIHSRFHDPQFLNS